MYVVIGASGQTGSVVADTLLTQGEKVRVVVRKPEQAEAWRARGAEAAIADVTDAEALTRAFTGAEAVYLMNPPAYTDPDLFARARLSHAAQIAAAGRARVKHLVALSSIGAQHPMGTGNIRTTHDLEQQLTEVDLATTAVTILRPGNFIENWSAVLAPARENGVLPSMFQPLDRKLPMQSATDVGEVAAKRMRAGAEGSRACRIVELSGPEDYAPRDAAIALSEILGRPVEAVAVPEVDWAGAFEASGFAPRTVEAFCEMYRGFNSGHIAFEGTHEALRGRVTLTEALRALVLRAQR